MKLLLFELYAFLFSNPFFYKWNKLLFHLSLRGLGILNYRKEILIGEKRWLQRELKSLKQPVVVDIGANVGNYTKTVLQIVSKAEVCCCEPHPRTYKNLELNLAQTNSKLFNIAMGNQTGRINIYDYKDKDGSSHASLYQDVIEDIHGRTDVISHQVQIMTLDNFIVENQIKHIDLLKIDTEGNELNVLLGAQNALKQGLIKRIQFEFSQVNVVSQVFFRNIYKLIEDRYNLYRLLPFGNLLELGKYSPFEHELYGFQNIIAILKNETK